MNETNTSENQELSLVEVIDGAEPTYAPTNEVVEQILEVEYEVREIEVIPVVEVPRAPSIDTDSVWQTSDEEGVLMYDIKRHDRLLEEIVNNPKLLNYKGEVRLANSISPRGNKYPCHIYDNNKEDVIDTIIRLNISLYSIKASQFLMLCVYTELSKKIGLECDFVLLRGRRDGSNIELAFVIKYPDIVITSDAGYEHYLGDMYVAWSVNRFIPTVYRERVSKVEADSGYFHSHFNRNCLSDNPLEAWGSFCTGATYFSSLISKLQGLENTCIDILTLQLTVYNFRDYLSTESTAGGPYRRLSTYVFKAPVTPRRISADNPLLYDYLNISTGKLLALLKNNYIKIHKERFFNTYNVEVEIVDYEAVCKILCNELYYMSRTDSIIELCTENQLNQIRNSIKSATQVSAYKFLFDFKGKEVNLLIDNSMNPKVASYNIEAYSQLATSKEFIKELKNGLKLAVNTYMNSFELTTKINISKEYGNLPLIPISPATFLVLD